jgi:hypothetical protein
MLLELRKQRMSTEFFWDILSENITGKIEKEVTIKANFREMGCEDVGVCGWVDEIGPGSSPIKSSGINGVQTSNSISSQDPDLKHHRHEKLRNTNFNRVATKSHAIHPSFKA